MSKSPGSGFGANPPLQQQFLAAVEAHKRGDLQKAASAYHDVLKADPRHFNALQLLGLLFLQVGQSQKAAGYLRQALAVDRRHAETQANLGVALQRLGQTEESITCFDRAISLKPGYAEAYSNRGMSLRTLGRLEEALRSYDKAVAANAKYADAHFNRANVLRDLQRNEEAIASFRIALQIRPAYPEAFVNLGLALLDTGKAEEALHSVEKALLLRPDLSEAQFARGNVLVGLERFAEALDAFDAALHLSPGNAIGWNNRGRALVGLNRLDEALASFEHALVLEPELGFALKNCGSTLRLLGRLTDSLACYERALAASKVDAEAHFAIALTLRDLGRDQEALDHLEAALAINPEFEFVQGHIAYTKATLWQWNGFQKSIASIEQSLRAGNKACAALHSLTLLSSPALQLAAARSVAASFPADGTRPLLAAAGSKARIGFFSADFRDHPVSVLSVGMFESHDRDKLEYIGFGFGSRKASDLGSRIEAAFDRFFDISRMSDAEAAALVRSLNLDVAVDMGGHTMGNRLPLFARRIAQVQMSYLGFAGTLGTGFIDYLVADSFVAPEAQRAFYGEKLLCLPGSFMPNDNRRAISKRVFERKDFGLPEDAFVFCCFNNSYKILPGTFDVWMRILKAVTGSVLWLPAFPAGEENLRREASHRGIDPQRIHFAPRMPDQSEHLARLTCADLFLDTFPYNAHTTACDALWAGLPVLTRVGEAFASRVAGSLLHAAGLGELVVESDAEYEALAIALAQDKARLAAITGQLRKQRDTLSIFDTQSYARNFERGLLQAVERARLGLPPEHITLD